MRASKRWPSYYFPVNYDGFVFVIWFRLLVQTSSSASVVWCKNLRKKVPTHLHNAQSSRLQQLWNAVSLVSPPPVCCFKLFLHNRTQYPVLWIKATCLSFTRLLCIHTVPIRSSYPDGSFLTPPELALSGRDFQFTTSHEFSSSRSPLNEGHFKRWWAWSGPKNGFKTFHPKYL